ncbi:MAG: hypothetical protein JKY71_03765 [Alphaproteobacteria bacterium]|nr:hypothetical protein [Alphaproteobacteria bacterium]
MKTKVVFFSAACGIIALLVSAYFLMNAQPKVGYGIAYPNIFTDEEQLKIIEKHLADMHLVFDGKILKTSIEGTERKAVTYEIIEVYQGDITSEVVTVYYPKSYTLQNKEVHLIEAYKWDDGFFHHMSNERFKSKLPLPEKDQILRDYFRYKEEVQKLETEAGYRRVREKEMEFWRKSMGK